MIYFLIIGIFLLPFVLNTINCIIPKQKLWLNPLFFLIIILGMFQILLSWFTTSNINNYLAFSVLSYLILVFVILFLLIFLSVKMIAHWESVNFKKIIKANYSSFVFGILMAIPLIVIAINNSLIIFSDTQAYINISSYFNINGVYTFDGVNNLDYTYRIPVGYYLNSVFSNVNYALAYRFLWVATTFYLFNWAIYYLVIQKLNYLKNITQFFLSGFFSIIYLCISFVSIYIFSGGNLEMQSMFIVVCFVLIATKNAKYFFITCFAFLLFSSTALILSCGVLLIGLVYLLFKGTRIQFITLLFTITAFLVIGVSFGLNEMSTHIYVNPYFGVIGFFVMFALFVFSIIYKKSSRVSYLLNKQLVGDEFKVRTLNILGLNSEHKFKTQRRISATKINQILLIVFYLLTSLAVFAISQFIVTLKAALPENMSYSSLGVMVVVIALAIYLSWRKNKISKLMFWICFFNISYIIVSLFFTFYDNLFSENASAWRIVYLTMSIGNFSTYVSLFAFLICEIIDANKLFFLNLIKPVIKTKKIHKNSLIFYYSTFGFGLTSIILASGTSATAWSVRQQLTLQRLGGDSSVLNSSWLPDSNDKKVFSVINDLNKNKDNLSQSSNQNLQPNNTIDKKDSLTPENKNILLPHFYFYTDLALASFLNNGSPLSYMAYWTSTFCNDFIKSDIRLLTVETRTVNELLYYNLSNTVANIDTIIDQSIQNMQKQNIFNITPSINVNSISSDINTPISKNAISITGAPELIILNKNTSYFKNLDLTKKVPKLGDIYYGDLAPDTIGPDSVGYEFIYETDNTAFYADSSLTEFINQFKKVMFSLSNTNQ